MSDVWFGLQPPVDAETSWGWRTIIDKGNDGTGRLDFVPGRGQARGPETGVLLDWLRYTAIQRIDGVLSRARSDFASYAAYSSLMDGRSKDAVAVDDLDFHFRASPNGSHGYVYCVAWQGGDPDKWDAERVATWGGRVLRVGEEG